MQQERRETRVRLWGKGFTLIELMLVLSLIGLLSTIVFASLNKATADARNANRLTHIDGFVKTFEFVFNDLGEYPDPGDNNFYCVGNHGDDACWINGSSNSENATLKGILTSYYGEIPYIEGQYGADNIEGYIYGCSVGGGGNCTQYTLRWIMEGGGESCGKGSVVSTGADYLECQFVFP